MTNKPIAVSLFSGIGGIDLGFSRAGFDVVAQVEINDFCQKVLRKHAPIYWPNARIIDDVKEANRHNLPASPDVLCGGFPCQDISAAGKGAGIKEGTRSGLWLEFARIIGEIRPKYVFIENVPAITTNGGSTVLSTLAALGYDAEWGIIPASAVGAPHPRERWWCVAYARRFDGRHDSRYEQGWQPSSEGYCPMDNADSERELQCERCERNIRRRDIYTGNAVGVPHCINAQRDGNERIKISSERLGTTPLESADSYIRSAWPRESIVVRAVDGLSRRLDSHQWPAGQGQFQYDYEPPRMTSRGLSDRIERTKALGNAVVPQVVEPFAIAIYEAIMQQSKS